jgi:hypothetical protein
LVPYTGATGGVAFGAYAQTLSDISTPAAPSAGSAKFYSKSGQICSLDSSSVETCLAFGGLVPYTGATGGVAFGAYAQTLSDISTPAAPSAGSAKFYSKSGKICSLDSSSVERCLDFSGLVPYTGATGGVAFGAYAQTATDISTPAAPAGGDTKFYTKGGRLCSLDSSSVERCSQPDYVPVTVSVSGVLHAGTYTSGLSPTCSPGNTCNLASFDGGGSSATATVACTGSNTIAGGTAIVVTAPGSGYTSAPTSATGSDGTATNCSGMAVVATSISVGPAVTGFYFADISSGGLTYVLPTVTAANVGIQICIRQAVTKTGALTLKLPASTYMDIGGANGSAAGTLVSAGAAGEAVCVVGVTTTQYAGYVSAGTWTNN